MSEGFRIDSRVKLCVDSHGYEALIVPDTNDQICVGQGVHVYSQENGWGWSFYATLSGVEIPVWDERPDRRPHPGSGTMEDQNPYNPCGILHAFADGKELFDAAVVAGIPLACSDPQIIKEALTKLAFIVTASEDPISFRRHTTPRPPKKRKLTQKRLDGSEDMTV